MFCGGGAGGGVFFIFLLCDTVYAVFFVLIPVCEVVEPNAGSAAAARQSSQCGDAAEREVKKRGEK